MRWSRGQASVVGVALLLGFTLVVVGATVALGYGAISQSTDRVAVEQAENALSQFDSAASEVALGASDTKRANLGSASGNVRLNDDSGQLVVTAANRSGGNATPRTLVNVSLGSVVFERGGETVAYQGGGVWRDGRVVSPPEVHYQNETLTLPIITVSGDGSGNGEFVIEKADASEIAFPNANGSNPLEGKRIEVTVTGPYYRGWYQYFETRTGGAATVNHSARSTTMTLTTPVPPVRITSGIVSGSAGTMMTFSESATIDGYNSSAGTLSETEGVPVNVTSFGPVTVKTATLNGNLFSEGSVTLDWGSGSIKGAIYTDAAVNHPDYYPAPPVYSLSSDLRPRQYPSSAGRVETAITEATASNDNDEASVASVRNGTLSCISDTCELGPGTYLVDEIEVRDGGDVTLNTTNGDVTLVVAGDGDPDDVDIDVGNNGYLRVVGENRANVYTTGDTDISSDGHVVTYNETANEETHRAPGFWLYTVPDSTVDIRSSGFFTGVVYGAGGGSQTGSTITVHSDGHVYGALVGNVEGFGNGGYLHYDHALADEMTALNDVDTQTASVSYLHVSVERLNVTRAG
ncbi:hypothetical protein EFA46_008545 [Halarchaeum sp. CBA1220]|uniref:DUF7289 family protein n=1 Tax=Halarchaeum sp. CBA1220 TaxID=1853682 RepID=UPI000F3AA5C1|nr:hypothetical protein [Halarchaeum sp. CBA1220]QLC34251.1 hypothetical protein EFA46_008545 [Halarchaeum sp. CBA1220]